MTDVSDGAERLDDPKLRFYLERRALIDEWAQLPQLESRAAADFLRSLVADLEQFAHEQGSEVAHHAIDSEELVALSRSGWRTRVVADDEMVLPQVMVAVVWSTRSVTFAGRNSSAYCGLVVPYASDRRVREVVGQALSEMAEATPFARGTVIGQSPWPRYRYEPCTYESYWNDLTPYRSHLVASVEEAWATFAPVVDAALARLDRRGPIDRTVADEQAPST